MKRFLVLILFFLSALGLSFIPVSIDYKIYSHATEAWLSNTSQLYDKNSLNYFYLPWSLFLTIPSSILPSRYGQTLLNFLSIWGLVFSVRTLVRDIKWHHWFLLLYNLFIVNMIICSQWDAIVTAGISLSFFAFQRRNPYLFGAGLLLASTKPTNMIIPLALLFFFALREWNAHLILKAMVLPAIILVWSFWACGPDWPFRYISFIQNYPPRPEYNISIWNQAQALGMPLVLAALGSIVLLIWFSWVVATTQTHSILIAASMVVNLVVSPYVLSYHFAATTPALAYILKINWRWGIVPYLIMIYILINFTDLLPRIPLLFYPISILLIMLGFLSTSQKRLSLMKIFP